MATTVPRQPSPVAKPLRILRDATQLLEHAEGDRRARLLWTAAEAARVVLKHSTDDDERRLATDTIDRLKHEHVQRLVHVVLEATRDGMHPREQAYITAELEARVVAKLRDSTVVARQVA